MACILHIETSTTVCSVALSVDSKLYFEKVSFDGPSHASLAGVYVEEALRMIQKEGIKPDAVAVSSGPGSYTGLRIGVSLAKGICFGYGIPLIAIPTLEILAYTAIQKHPLDSGGLYCAMLDARRMEVYSALYDSLLSPVRETLAEIITPDSFADYLDKSEVCFLGNGAAKCKEILSSSNAYFLEDIHPLASHMIPLAEKAYVAGKFEDTAYYEPFYLKEFQATIAKNKVLG
ncbi:tRNA (adenosine(37)-N6)-threonylcarbamoyltransferase complex dimerization subunit type 1 TsaB [Parabacteroides sp. 52]|uniref:tRNA (adenosine(37)-N6)-threonylcarbamoyltransferase complex dimerization subunit type 1 TsaB n=1 Tax=unclassified Parabacteroides TaxID=2649774 RepID=UPI0013D0D926|nr:MULTISPECIES: tRNA (adenosine(37)-N6)-threonylcarbamoyltransferase complex dimerization subunit type 1 TsaB [unclassified Parabacteroides]MDH6533687.1 tRNA threonylcarbamoyladenosine biosynthesis protein TsaB [Parabacteroides sp. PM5-20]NDV54440.1 tRNA (adenosine(37)-N6)-threonylcarbamoyltransferase complex dimerization subunit type 1 TsaB [Parabacteroides sp. 52]